MDINNDTKIPPFEEGESTDDALTHSFEVVSTDEDDALMSFGELSTDDDETMTYPGGRSTSDTFVCAEGAGNTDEELMYRAVNLLRKKETKTHRLDDTENCRRENKKRINRQKTPQFVTRQLEVPETTSMIEEDDKFDDANNCRGTDESEEMEMETSRIATIDVQERERFNSLVKNSTIIRRSYNTTSSVYADNTIDNPNVSQMLFCVAAVIQAQIFDDYTSNEVKIAEIESKYTEFSCVPSLPTHLGGDFVEPISDELLQREASGNNKLFDYLRLGIVPPLYTVYKFLIFVNINAKYSMECNIIALVFLNRVTSTSGIVLTSINWRMLLIISIILAQKVWDDSALKTSSFVNILPLITRHQLKCAELSFITLINYNTRVSPSLYAKYYFELRSLHAEICGAKMEWALMPLTKVNEIKLDNRSSRLAIKKRQESEKKQSKQSESASINEVDAMLSPLPLKLPTTRNILRTTFSEAVPQREKDTLPEIRVKSSKVRTSSRSSSTSSSSSTPNSNYTILTPSKDVTRISIDNVSKTLEELTIKKTSRYIIS
jgi:hypothetical protein